MNLPALTIGAEAFEQGEFTDVSAASRAVIGARAGQKLTPAILAQTIIGLTNALLTVNADCGPEKLIRTLQGKGGGSF